MRPFKYTAAAAVLALAAGSSGSAFANSELITMEKNPNDWVMQNGNYANQRFSELDPINAGNVGDMRVSWTFSTGVLRGHEGGPLVIGDTMYVHAPFPNTVFALDLNNDGRITFAEALRHASRTATNTNRATQRASESEQLLALDPNGD